uniref:Retroviral envelope protein GP41-like domain-containing protein n=1 Tax=Molossus molossus TaxID=27622 RepID=A0A7J8JV73_MOLMO|nr:hypothetical protein HJG59_007851 [Molossus molossus]
MTCCLGQAIGLITASLLGLAAVTATTTVAGVALHQGIQTAEFVQNWHWDSHLLWQQQQEFYFQMAVDIQNLKQTIERLGDQISVLSTKSMLKCDWNSSHICVTPLPYNVSEGWDKITRTLIGHANLTNEILALEKEIENTYSNNLPSLTGGDILESLADGIANLNPFGQIKTLVSTTLSNTIVLLIILFIAFLVFRRWSQQRAVDNNNQNMLSTLQHVTSQIK